VFVFGALAVCSAHQAAHGEPPSTFKKDGEMKVKSRMLAVALAMLALGATASTASAQSLPLPLPSAPSLPSAPDNPIVGTGGQCDQGLIVVNLGGTTVCAVPDAPQVGAAPACPDGSVAATVSAQALVCLLPGGGQAACPSSTVAVQSPTGGSVLCVLPTNIQAPGAGGCSDGLIPVQILGGSLGCLSAAVLGGPGANGANGANGAPATPAKPTTTTTTTTTKTTSASKSRHRIYKPTLKLTKRLRGSRMGLVRSSTRKVVITTIGRRHGRVVRFTKQFHLKRSGPATAARPYSARVKITVKTKGRLSIRITSRGGGSIKTAVFKRTVRAR
jgi:hypothetical protein